MATHKDGLPKADTLPAPDGDEAPVSMKTHWPVLVAVGAGTFMSALDASIVNVALPTIRVEMLSTVSDVEWVVSAYLLVVSCTLLVFGRLGDLRGHKNAYLAGFGVFGISSALCGFAPSTWALVAFRTLQAIGAAMLFANSPAILTRTFPGRLRGRVLGLTAAMTYLGLTIGPPLGGWLTTTFSWRAVFFVNVPVAAALTLLAYFAIGADAHPGRDERFDLLGATLFAVGLVATMSALNRMSSLGWSSPTVLIALAVGAAALGAFVARERVAVHPVLDLSLFAHRTFAASAATALLMYVAVYSVVFLMPFYLVHGRGFTPAHAGLLLMTQSVVMALVAPLSGALADRFGTRTPATSGLFILMIGLLLLARLDGVSTTLHIVGALAVVGLGAGLFVSPNNSALMGAAPRNRQGIASAVLAEARTVGMAFGIGVAGAVFTGIMGENPPGMTLATYLATAASFAVAAAVALVAAVVSLAQRPDGARRGRAD